MSSLNPRTLRQILRHEIVQRSLGQLAELLGSVFRIVDEQGATLSGDANLATENRVPVIYAGNTVAWLLAPRHGAALATALEGLIAIEMEKKAVAADALEMYREINLLFHLHEAVYTNLNLGEVCDSLVGEARRLVNCEDCMIFLAEEGSGQLRLAAGGKSHHREIVPLNSGIVAHVFATGVADIFNQVGQASYFAGETDYPAMICVPLKASDSQLGVFVAAGNGPFSANDLKLLTTLASHGAVILRNAQLYTELNDLFLSTVSVLAETIEKRDPYTAGHTQRVTDYSVETARLLGVSPKDISNLRLSATLHDVGKIGVRDHILLKTSPLDSNEVAQMNRHTEHGADILNCSRLLRSIVDGVRYHHERFDGKGYNYNLQGQDIPFHARIIAVADAFDAMTTDRPYRKGMDFEVAATEIRKGSGSQFDPSVVDAFLRTLETRIGMDSMTPDKQETRDE